MSTPTNQITPRQIITDKIGYELPAYVQNQFDTKIYNPLDDENAFQKLSQQHSQWLESGNITVFTTGVFDMLHPDHSAYLTHTKAIGALALFELENPESSWDDLSKSQRTEYVAYALGSKVIKQVVSVDGDKTVAERKGFNPQKGNSLRPIYAWQTRAKTVASLSYIKPIGTSQELVPTVDAVTLHGPKDITDKNHPNHNHFTLASALRPSVWAFFGESQDILDAAPAMTELRSKLVCVPDGRGTHYYVDPIIGKMSTTSIINRIKG